MDLNKILHPSQIKSYLKHLRSQGASEATLKRKSTSLKKFSEWMEKENRWELASSSWRKKERRKEKKQAKPIFRYFAFLAGLILLAGFGWGIYTQFFAHPKEKPSLALPTTPPALVSFQGRLTDSVGTPITATVSATFKLYNVETGGTALWSETKDIDPDQDGIFATKLGDTTPIDPTIFRDNVNVWLGITVDGDNEMTPRQQIATVGYAYNAQYLQGYAASASATANTVPIINSDGDLVIAASSPTLKSTSGTFAIKGQALTITTDTGTNGDISIQPDGTGQVIVYSGTTTGDSFQVQNSNITSGSLISGEAATSGTGFNLINLSSGATPTTKFSVSASGVGYFADSVGIGTTSPDYKLHVVGDGYFSTNLGVGGTATVENLKVSSEFFDSNDSAGSNGNILTSTGTGTSWADASSISVGNADTLDNLDSTDFLRATADDTFESGNTLTIAGDLDINGNLSIADTDITLDGASTNFASTGNISFNTNQLFIDQSNGYIGIGTSSPSYQFHVSGSQSDYLSYIYNSSSNSSAAGLYLRTDGDGNILTLNASGSDIVTVSESQTTFNNPTSFNSSGDVSIAYDLIFTNQTSSKIESYGPLTIEAGESFESNDLTLKTYNSGDIILQASSGNIWADGSNVGIGTTAPAGQFDVGGGNLVVLSGGNVGIGTTNPSAKLDVNGTIYASKYQDPAATGYSLDFANDPSLTVPNSVGIGDTSPDAKLDILNSGSGASFRVDDSTDGDTTPFIIDADGNVGIGTTSPATTLEVVTDSGSLAPLRLRSTNDSGYAGLDLFDSTNTLVSSFVHSNSSASVLPSSTWLGSRAAEPLHLVTNGATPRLTILSDGNVGIGTTNPEAKLDIKGDAIIYHGQSDGLVIQRDTLTKGKSGGGLFLTGGGYSSDKDNGGIFAGTWNDLGTYRTVSDAASGILFSDGKIAFKTASGLAGDGSTFTFPTRMSIDSSGNVGIGTTGPGAQLDIRTPGGANDAYGLRLTNSVSGRSWNLYSGLQAISNDRFGIRDNTAGAYRFVIDENGNVGIGTASPGAKLHVVGNAKLSGGSAAFLFSNNDSNPNIIAINTVNYGGDTQGGWISVNSKFNGFPNWTKTSSSASDNALFMKLAPAKLGIQFGDASNSGGTNPGTEIFTLSNSGNTATIKGWTSDDTSAALNILDSSSNSLLYVRNDGNVGIGTASPGAKLDFYGGTAMGSNTQIILPENAIIQGGGTPTSRTSSVQFTAEAGTTAGYGAWLNWNAYYDNTNWRQPRGNLSSYLFTSNYHLGFDWKYAAAGSSDNGVITPTSLMRLNNSGNLGLGTTDPGQKLDVVGNVIINNGTSSKLYIKDTNQKIETDSANRLRMVALNHDIYLFGGINNWQRANADFYFDANLDGSGVNYFNFRDGSSVIFQISTEGKVHAPSLGSSSTSNYALHYDASTGHIYYYTSSLRYKHSVEDLDSFIDTSKIYDLRPASYIPNDGDSRDFGLIAEEVYETIPQLAVLDNQGRPDAVRYEQIGVLLLDQMIKNKPIIDNVNLDETGSLIAQFNPETEPDIFTYDTVAEATSAVENQEFTVQDNAGDTVKRMANFAKMAVGGIKSGLVSATNLISENLITKKARVEEKLLSPILETDEITMRDNDLTITDQNREALASFDGNNKQISVFGDLNASGSAQFSGSVGIGQSVSAPQASFGDLLAKEINADQIKTNTLQVNQEATISGTLYADRIIAKEGGFGNLLGENVSVEDIKSIVKEEIATAATESATPTPDEEEEFDLDKLLAEVEEWAGTSTKNDLPLDCGNTGSDGTEETSTQDTTGLETASNEKESFCLIDKNFTVLGGHTSLADTSIAGQLSVDSLIIADNAIDTIDSPLYLQKMGLNGLDILNGQVIVDVSGNVFIKKDLEVGGNLIAATIKPQQGQDLTIDLNNTGSNGTTEEETQGDKQNESGFGKLLVKGINGEIVASIDASGSAQFKKIATEALQISANEEATASGAIIAAGSNYQQTGIYAPGVKTNATAGQATLPAGETALIIYNNKITEKSMVYLTPTSDTQNQVLYVKEKKNIETTSSDDGQTEEETGYFVVGINKALDVPVKFNWWIIN